MLNLDQELTPSPSLGKRGEVSLNSISYTSRDINQNLVPISNGLRARARDLRKNQTAAEKLLWKNLRGKKLAGYKFLRQHPILGYIVDFYCHEAKLIIEADGSSHANKKAYDSIRDQEFLNTGIQTIRVKNKDIFDNLHLVLLFIELTLTSPFSSQEKGAGGMSSAAV